MVFRFYRTNRGRIQKRYQNATEFVLFKEKSGIVTLMSKLDWAVAESTYITKSEASYDWLAQMFGVAKSTIVRRAVKRSWPEKREKYVQKRIDTLEERTLEKRVDVEERELKILRNVITLFHNEILRLGLRQQQGDDVRRDEWSTIASLTHAITKAIMTERTILGLPSKLIRIKNQEAIKDIQEMMGYTHVPFYEQYRLTKELLEGIDIDAIMKHKKILEKYVEEVEETGDVNTEHPLWKTNQPPRD